MPIATPPPDIDPTVVPPVSTHPTQAEAWETGVSTEPPAAPQAPLTHDKHVTDLVKLWPEHRCAVSRALAWHLHS